MRKQNKTILDVIGEFPWWAIIILAFAVFVSFKYWIPTIEFKNIFFNAMAKGLPAFAPYAAGLLLLVAGKSAYNSWRKGNLLEKQKDINSIRLISWQEFEELVGEVYRRKGYHVTEFGGGGADGGVDLILKRNGEVIFIQCKHWRMDKVGVSIVRELYGVMTAEGATGGIVISSGTFTQESKDFAKGKPIEMIEGQELANIVINLKKTKNIIAKKESSQIINKCPLCGSDMVLRTAKKGTNVGEKFWGCSTFPKCRGIKSFSV